MGVHGADWQYRAPRRHQPPDCGALADYSAQMRYTEAAT